MPAPLHLLGPGSLNVGFGRNGWFGRRLPFLRLWLRERCRRQRGGGTYRGTCRTGRGEAERKF
jgi:hypothetical protein